MTNLAAYKLIKNPTGANNSVYAGVISFLLDNLNLIKLIKDAYTSAEPILPEDMDPDEVECFEPYELRTMCYADKLEGLDWAVYKQYATDLGLGTYFPSSGVSDLFLSALEDTRCTFLKLQQCIKNEIPVDYKKDFEPNLLYDLGNLNFCIMHTLKLFMVPEKEILVAMKEFVIANSLDIESLYKECYEVYKEHRPNLPLFVKYPELAEKFESIIEPRYFSDLIVLSDYITQAELNDILSGELIVDSTYLDSVLERAEGSQIC